MTEEDINETIVKIRIDFLQKRIMSLQDQIGVSVLDTRFA